VSINSGKLAANLMPPGVVMITTEATLKGSRT